MSATTSPISSAALRRRRELQETCDGAAADFAAWRAGERGALDRLVHRLTPLLWHTVRAYRLDEAAAEDVVQQTWLAFVRSADKVSDPQAVVRYLTVTARRAAWREARAVAEAEPVEDEVLQLRPDEGPSVEEIVERGARDEALWRAVTTLSERCQRLLRVIAFAERPDYEALASALGMRIGSIGPTRGRCLEKLRKALGSHDEGRTA